MISSAEVGYVCAVLSTLLSGSWQAAIKSDAIQKHNLHPAVLNLEFVLGFSLASWIAIIFDMHDSYHFTPWGIVAGALYDGSMCLNMGVSFPVLGIAIGSGIASSFAVITSFVWSAGIFQQDMRSVSIAFGGVAIVVIGLNIIILTGRSDVITECRHKKSGGWSGPKGGGLRELEETPLRCDDEVGVSTADKGDKKGHRAGTKRWEFIVAVGGGCLAGLFGGSFLVPSMSCCADEGIIFLPSMGLGCLLVAPVLSAGMFLFVPSSLDRPAIPPRAVIIETLPWGMLSGAVSALAIVLIIKAIDNIDYVVASTLSQTSIFITGLWGWLFFGELDSPQAAWSFFAGAGILVGGAVIVAYYGTTN